ncbi:MAG: hypothetical protein U0792_04335 [Gemmataceae bacterium]
MRIRILNGAPFRMSQVKVLAILMEQVTLMVGSEHSRNRRNDVGRGRDQLRESTHQPEFRSLKAHRRSCLMNTGTAADGRAE